MEPIAEKIRYTVEEYIALVQESDSKYEYVGGQIYGMAGGTPEHSLIATNTTRELGNNLKGKPGRIYNSDLALAISQNQYVYPAASIICGPVQTGEMHKNAATNPVVIIEVFSPSTKGFDKRAKFRLYRPIPSFRQYVQIIPNQILVDVFTKVDDDLWRIASYWKLSQTVRLESVDAEIPMSEIYLGVDLQEDQE
ncbi:Uma2 family endonuclease [Larkinella rosea]|uniref:Uma2 family endonuclease n=1 Tax=Larkinella rosea TaxID=2025312 RepID=A0A3P1C3B6_9BACT|nr:Uma2 family endonuclease [Larkinella rosea]RRB07787.1 Uma2 family endonuclease [Larkinella rosea]